MAILDDAATEKLRGMVQGQGATASESAILRGAKSREERLEKDRTRKKDERARAKVEAEFQNKMKDVTTIQSFWDLSRSGLTPEKLAAHREQQGLISQLLIEMQRCLDGKADDLQIAETNLDVEAAIECYGGIANITAPLLLPEFWLNESDLNRLTSGETPSAIFAKFGFVTAVPDYSLHQWNDFVARNRASVASLLYISPIQLHCVTPGCKSLPTSMSPETATAYMVRGGYRCQACLDLAAKAKAFIQQQRREPTVLDEWGRAKDSQRQ
jgi:hypothetical protein